MGSTWKISQQEAANMLGVTPRTFRKLAQRHHIHKLNCPGTFYDGAVVEAISRELKADHSLHDAAVTAGIARAETQSLGRRVKQLEAFLGMDSPPLLEMDDQTIRETHALIGSISTRRPLSMQRIKELGDIFFATCELYFTRVTEVTGDKEPWNAYLGLGVRVLKFQDLAKSHLSREEKATYAFFHRARTHLRHAVFFHLVSVVGMHAAKKAFSNDFDRAKELRVLASRASAPAIPD